MKGRSHTPARHCKRSIRKCAGGLLFLLLPLLLLLASCTQKTTVVIPDSNTGTADTIAQKHVIKSK